MNFNTYKIVYEGKAKILYNSDNPDHLIQFFKDDATANNAEKHDVIKSKGILNNLISEFLMTELNKKGISTHFIKRINDREQLIKRVYIIPVELVIRNIASGSLVKRYDIEEGKKLTKPLIEFFYKNDKLNDPLLIEDHLIEFKLANQEEINIMKNNALRANNILKTIFRDVGVKLIDFKLEFGKINSKDRKEIIIADEISPDNCRLWDEKTNQKLDKDIFRKNLGNLIDGYKEVAKRLGIKKINLI